MNKKLLALAILGISAGVSADSEIKETPRAGVYADTEWVTAHGGPRNDDYISSIQEFPRYYESVGTVLEGAGVPLGPTRGPNGHFYAATAQAEGNSNLTAFDAEGNIIWQSLPWQTGADFDPGGVISAPVVDEDGIVYHSDANQMWAFYPDGEVKWVTELPDPVNGYSTIFDELNLPVKPNSITNAFLTMPVDDEEHTAYVGGITIYGDILIFDRKDGRIVAGPVNMPGDFEPRLLQPAPGAFAPPFVAEGWNYVIWTYFHGGVESANVPGVNPKDGRIFATGMSSKSAENGAIHGFEFNPETREINFVYEAQIGMGSGSSPAISSDYNYVYASDESGTLFKYRTDDDSSPVWTTNVASLQASASLGGPGDDKIYLYDDKHIYSLKHEDGSIAWKINLRDLAATLLPDSPLSDPTICDFFGLHNGIVISTAGDDLIATTVLGYNWDPINNCQKPAANEVGSTADPIPGDLNIPVAIRQGMWVIDKFTGEIQGDMIPAGDTNGGFTVPTHDGYLMLDRGTLSSGMNKLFYPLTESKFPEDYKPILPVGGIEILQGKDDIKITSRDGSIQFDEGFSEKNSSLKLSDKRLGKSSIKGKATGEGNLTYKVSIQSNHLGSNAHGSIQVKKGKRVIHSIMVDDAVFNDRSVTGTGRDKETKRKIDFYIADWR